MGSTGSADASELAIASSLNTEKKAQYRELYDISCTYLEHFEYILESQQCHEDPREVLSVLKANLQTAREQISKLPSKPNERRRYSSSASHSKSLHLNSQNSQKMHRKTQSSSNVPNDWVVIEELENGTI